MSDRQKIKIVIVDDIPEARDKLNKPPPADELYETVRRVAEQMREYRFVASPDRDGPRKLEIGQDTESHVIVVYSPQGGAGKTTVATNMATALMREGTRVLLMDCDLQFGDVGVFLNLKPNLTILDLIKSVDDLDTDLVEKVLVTHDSGLRVLLAPARPEDAELVPQDKVPQLVEKLRGMFDFIVVDLPTPINEVALALFDIATRVLLVVNPTLPSVKNALAVMAIMDSLEYPEAKTQLVLNKVTADLERNKITIAIAAIEAKLRRKALGLIPMDERRVLFAVNRGIAVVSRDRNLSPARDLIALADALIENVAPPPAEQAAAPAAVPGKAQQSSRLQKLFRG